MVILPNRVIKQTGKMQARSFLVSNGANLNKVLLATNWYRIESHRRANNGVREYPTLGYIQCIMRLVLHY